MTKRLEGKIDKGWGYEIIWATNDKYCGKILVFEREGAKFSMHFHKEKDETWFVNAGQFKLIYCDTRNATYHEKILNEGDVWRNPPMMPHQLIAMKPNSMIFEVSTSDSVEDNYRIIQGDSQSATSASEPAND
jgi:mannose-6-phosphate isomerase-like protein (cupin superfamily)